MTENYELTFTTLDSDTEPTTSKLGLSAFFGFDMSDIGIAHYVASMYGTSIRYITDMGVFYAYSTARHIWERDAESLKTKQYIVSAVDKLAEKAQHAEDLAKYVDSKEARKALESVAKTLWKLRDKYHSKTKIQDVLECLKLETTIAGDSSIFDKNPLLFGVKNGVVNLQTGELLPHRKDYYLSKASPVEYNPQATCPTWESMLEKVQPNVEIRNFIQRIVGYALVGYQTKQHFIVFHGEKGMNGKSTFMKTLSDIMGDYAKKANQATFLKGNGGGKGAHQDDLVYLVGARMVSISETAPGAPLDESLVKAFTSGDEMTARGMYKSSFSFRPTALPILDSNYKPKIVGDDGGIWRRLLLVSWDIQIPADEVDLNFQDKLRNEYPGILAWCVRGAAAFTGQQGISPPQAIVEATRDYRLESDNIQTFLNSNFEAVDGDTLPPPSLPDLDSLFALWKAFCEDNEIKAVGAKNGFGQKLVARGVGRKLFKNVGNRYLLRKKNAAQTSETTPF